MFGWLRRLRPATPDAAAAAPGAPRPHPPPTAGSPVGRPGAATPAVAIAAAASTPAAPGAALPSALAWLLGAPPPEARPLAAAEQAALQVLDTMLAQPRWPADLLPRAPAVIPHLLALLRQDLPTRAAVVQQVAKDLALAAEVLRMARSPFYRRRGDVDTLDAAVDLLGTTGLQSAIARVVLKPVFDGQGSRQAARVGARLWELAERKADACTSLAAPAGVDRFDAYLAGLLHDTGWTALLRVLDRAGVGLATPTSMAFDAALADRHDRCFARLAADWEITPALTALALGITAHGLTNAPGALAHVLRQADRACAPATAGGGEAIAA